MLPERDTAALVMATTCAMIRAAARRCFPRACLPGQQPAQSHFWHVRHLFHAILDQRQTAFANAGHDIPISPAMERSSAGGRRRDARPGWDQDYPEQGDRRPGRPDLFLYDGW
jgi:hypothetical protein